jgi:hypothetical protein
MVFLLAIAGIAGDSALVASLRSLAVENESSPVRTLGYYEGLINTSRYEGSGDETSPPPGWRPFGGDEK